VYHVTKQLNSIPVLADVSDQWECVHKGTTFARLYVGERFTNVHTQHAFPKNIQLFLRKVTMVLEHLFNLYYNLYKKMYVSIIQKVVTKLFYYMCLWK